MTGVAVYRIRKLHTFVCSICKSPAIYRLTGTDCEMFACIDGKCRDECFETIRNDNKYAEN